MYPPHERLPKRLMHGPVARNPAHPGKALGPDFDPEMALAPLLIPCMATMALAIIDHLKLTRLKRGTKPIMNFLCHGHFFL